MSNAESSPNVDPTPNRTWPEVIRAAAAIVILTLLITAGNELNTLDHSSAPNHTEQQP